MVRPASISHVADFNHDSLVDLSSSLIMHQVIVFLLHLFYGLLVLLGLSLLVALHFDINVVYFSAGHFLLVHNRPVQLAFTSVVNAALGLTLPFLMLLLLFPLSLQLFAQVLLLLGSKSFEKFAVPHFVGGRFLGDHVLLFLLLHKLSGDCIDLGR